MSLRDRTIDMLQGFADGNGSWYDINVIRELIDELNSIPEKLITVKFVPFSPIRCTALKELKKRLDDTGFIYIIIDEELNLLSD